MHKRLYLVKDLVKHFYMDICQGREESPQNISREAGKTGRGTAGNRCEEEEECLSTMPTQTATSQFPESAFHPTTIGCIPL